MLLNNNDNPSHYTQGDATPVRETPKAICLNACITHSVSGEVLNREVWLPKSAIKDGKIATWAIESIAQKIRGGMDIRDKFEVGFTPGLVQGVTVTGVTEEDLLISM